MKFYDSYNRLEKVGKFSTPVSRMDKAKLIALMNTHVTEANLNEYGCFDDLKATIDKQKAQAYFEALEGQTLLGFKVNIKAASLLQRFILEDGFELEEIDHS